MPDDTALPFALPAVGRKKVTAAFDGGRMTSVSRLRRSEVGHHHHIAGVYLSRYAQESAWREGHRRESNGAQSRAIIGLALAAKPSVDFCGYWQRAVSGARA